MSQHSTTPTRRRTARPGIRPASQGHSSSTCPACRQPEAYTETPEERAEAIRFSHEINAHMGWDSGKPRDNAKQARIVRLMDQLEAAMEDWIYDEGEGDVRNVDSCMCEFCEALRGQIRAIRLLRLELGATLE